MKKTYQNPEMEIVRLANRQQLLAGSIKEVSEETPQEWGAHDDSFEW